MAEKKISPTKRLQTLLQNALADLPEPVSRGSIIRAIPVLVPIVDAIWRVQLKIPIRLGMVERHIIEGVRRFGPVTSEALDSLTGLGAARIDSAVANLIKQGAPIKSRGTSWQMSMDATDAGSNYYREAEQEYGFVFNGITGDLLPIDFWRNHTESRILKDDPDMESMSRIALLLNKTSFSRMPAIVSGASTCDEGQQIGLPEGFVCAVGDYALRESAVSVAAFLLVNDRGDAVLQSAGRPSLGLNMPPAPIGQYLAASIGKWRQDWLSPKLSQKECEDALPADPGISAKQEESGVFSISMAEPSRWLSWDILRDKQGSDESSFGWSLYRGWAWTGGRGYTLLRYLPGDQPTAERLLLLKGSGELLRECRKLSSRESLETWWHTWQEEQLSTWGGRFSAIRMPVNELLDIAHEYPDQEFREYIREIRGNSFQAPAEHPIQGNADAGIGELVCKDIGAAILEAIRGAKHSIDVITPVLEDSALLDVLGKRPRDVIVRAITAMKKRQEHVGFATLGLDGTDIANAANAALVLRRLADMDIACREPRCYPHAKMILIDGETLFLSSANLNTNSLGWNPETASLEAGIQIKSHSLAEACRRLYEALWDSCPYRHALRGHLESGHENTYDIREEKGISFPANMREQEIDGNALIVSDPDRNNRLANAIAKLIDSAKQRVVLSTLSIYDTDRTPKFHAAMLNALHRKVAIDLCIRPSKECGYKEPDWPDPATQALINAGLRIHQISRLHVKGILVDGVRGGIFSGNLNPYSLDNEKSTGHLEVGLFGDAHGPVLREYLKFIGRLPDTGQAMPRVMAWQNSREDHERT